MIVNLSLSSPIKPLVFTQTLNKKFNTSPSLTT